MALYPGKPSNQQYVHAGPMARPVKIIQGRRIGDESHVDFHFRSEN